MTAPPASSAADLTQLEASAVSAARSSSNVSEAAGLCARATAGRASAAARRTFQTRSAVKLRSASRSAAASSAAVAAAAATPSCLATTCVTMFAQQLESTATKGLAPRCSSMQKLQGQQQVF